MGYSPIFQNTLEAVLEQLGVDNIKELEEKEQERVISFCEDLTSNHWDEFSNRFDNEMSDIEEKYNPEEEE